MNYGQLFVVGTHATTCDDSVKEWYRDDPVGGVILFQRNVLVDEPAEAARQALLGLTSGIRACSAEAGVGAPFLMIDHEGGRVHRFGDHVTRFPPPGRLSPLGPDRVAEVCWQQSRELRSLGFNTVLGPVLDVCPEAGTASHIAARSYSGDPALAAALGARAIATFRGQGILPVPKHFPGYGSAPIDPHLDLPTRTDSLEALLSHDLVPFAQAVSEGAAAIMTAHIVATAIDSELPCTLSRAWLDYLRRDLGFSGCVVSDDLCMASVKDRYPLPDLCERSLRAGLDLLLVCHSEPGSLREACAHLEQVASEDPEFAARAADAVARVSAARALLDPSTPAALEPTAELFAAGERLRAELAEQGATW